MAQSIYSFYGSRLHLILEDTLAEAYNRFLKCWYEAQQFHHQLHEKPWDPKTEPIEIRCDEEDKKAYDQVGRVINLLVEINGSGLDLPEEECTADYLVKL